MQGIVVVLFVLTLCTGLALGIRLLWLYRETRGTPELVIGLAALFICTSGIVRGVMTNLPPESSPNVALALQILFSALYAAAPTGMVLGTWRVFRPDDRWAAVLALSLSAGMLGTVPLGLVSELQAPDSLRGIAMISLAAIVSAWTAFEALSHYGKLRRRMRLGLSDSVTTGQFLSWGLAMLANTVLRVITLGLVAGAGVEPMHSTAFMLPAAFLGFLTLAFLYCAFFPPLALQDWLSSRDAVASRA